MNQRIQPEGLLSGLRILDLTRYLPGPVATQQLADMGAEVLKIEDEHGDPARHLGAPRGNSLAFQAVNRHKRFATLDLKCKEHQQQLLELAAGADALIEGFRPGAMQRLGLDWNTLHAANPKLVLCSISGYGQNGPYAHFAGHDINYLALAGALHPVAEAHGIPVLPNLQMADMLGAQAAATGIVAALLHARIQGKGMHVDIALADAALGANPLGLAAANAGQTLPLNGKGMLNGGAPCYGLYRCADGQYLAVGALEAKFWTRLVQGMELPELESQHWSQGLRPGSPASEAIRQKLAACFATAPRDEWLARLEPLDCCVTPVLNPAEALQHPVFTQRNVSGVLPQPNSQQQFWVASPQRIVGKKFAPVRGAQAPGQDNPASWAVDQ